MAATHDSISSRKEGGSAGNRGKGRRRGVPNKITSILKDAIILAAEEAGGSKGLVGYLTRVANDNPSAFVPLLGKVLPLQVKADVTSPITIILSDADRALC